VNVAAPCWGGSIVRSASSGSRTYDLLDDGMMREPEPLIYHDGPEDDSRAQGIVVREKGSQSV
jgi:hypothetical protein